MICYSPEGRKFRTRSEVRAYLDNRPDIEFSNYVFDFSMTLKRVKKQPESSKKAQVPQTPAAPPPSLPTEPAEVHESATLENSAEEEGVFIYS